MGLCICKSEQSQSDDESFTQQVQRTSSISSTSSVDHGRRSRYDSVHQVWDLMTYSTVDKLVLETLSIIGSLVDNDFEPPPSMTKLHLIADKQKGWLSVVNSMVNVIPKDDPLGPAVITLLLDDCPLPTKETVGKLSKMFSLSSQTAIKGRNDPKRHRNICIVLGCIADKLAGPSSVTLLTQETLDYLLTCLDLSFNSSVILFAMIALEKFAQTGVNKQIIDQNLSSKKGNPLEALEKLIHSDKCVEKEIGFCAQWSLDNLFLKKGRTYSYEHVDRTNLNSMLNADDVSEYLKIAADGLTARCDASSFESVRCTSRVDSGIWYYEATVITPGVMQIGWATKNSKFLNHEGYGIGDDEYSLAYDGCRQLIWYNASSYTNSHRRWKAGDVVGSLIDLENFEIIFYLNGQTVTRSSQVFQNAKSGFFAAASFMSYQQCEFNFGRTPFKYPPKHTAFKSFNEFFSLTKEEQIILPRHLKLEKLTQDGISEGSCSLCFDECASVLLNPCEHRGFCMHCALQLEVCPICRSNIEQRVEIT